MKTISQVPPLKALLIMGAAALVVIPTAASLAAGQPTWIAVVWFVSVVWLESSIAVMPAAVRRIRAREEPMTLLMFAWLFLGTLAVWHWPKEEDDDPEPTP